MAGKYRIPAGDTRLHARHTPGPDPTLVLVNGGFTTRRYWKPVLTLLDGAHATVTFDARGRGRSGTSSDYSLATAVDDLGRVIQATGATRPVLVGWSYGASVAVRYALAHADSIRGVVLVDGAFPITMFDDAARERVRARFTEGGLALRLSALLGNGLRMAPAEAAEVSIELDASNGDLDYASLRVPASFVMASGPHAGSSVEDAARRRAAVTLALDANDLVNVHGTSEADHVGVLTADPGLIIGAARDVIARSAS
ncbi:alpha/beta hydrolase [Actinomadura harenae]|uniref:Alpha/beta fold hydrolase n=1 Tax=Actinomadura harenae TaxID=2483351 RepID=A0A3M2MBY0_9ACTN|nr:alpha/beta fold hydrolase [Actinomadura harenae]RMI47011.1 alpha/beta fold hydrolase [Actinomadura harenae]